MTRLKFGGFLAPHHPIGENPTLQYQRDLALAKRIEATQERRAERPTQAAAEASLPDVALGQGADGRF